MAKYNIIPKPNKYISGDSTYAVSSKTNVLCSEEFVGAGNIICDYLKTKPEENEGAIKVTKVPGMEREAYTLKITNDGVFISASDFAGAFYGAVTLKTILMQAKKQGGKAILETLIIEDKPEIAYRGLMLDSCRHYFEADIIKDLLDNMAMLKINKLHWHLSEDQGYRIESKIYPQLNEIGSKRASRHLKGCGLEQDNVEYCRYYTQDEIKEIVQYAAKRNIEIIPEIDLPGHTMDFLASMPELSCTGEKVEVLSESGVSKAILCAGNEEVFTFLDNLLAEVCSLFPSKTFHIGGDEAFKGYKIWNECDKCKAKKAELNIKSSKDLQVWFMNRVTEILKKYGKTPIAWDDCANDKLDTSVSTQLWQVSSINEVRKQAKKRDIIVSPTSYFYFDYKFAVTPLRKTYSFNLAKIGLAGSEYRVKGMECEIWTEFIDGREALEFTTYPRLQAFSEVAWTKLENRNYKDFHKRLDWYKTYMKKKNINYSRVERVLFDAKIHNVFHCGFDGKEYKMSEKLKAKENN